MKLIDVGKSALPGRLAFRAGPVGGTFHPRTLIVLAIGLLLLVLVGSLGIGRGSSYIPLNEVLATLAGGGDNRTQGIIFDLRLPRTLTGILVGAALGLAGAIFQSVARNPLASPDILGITWGAGVGAVGIIVLSGGLSAIGVPLGGLLGGLTAGLLLYTLSWRNGIDGYRMVLIGIGISAVGYNIVLWLLTVGDVNTATSATMWMVGNLSTVGWESVGPVLVALTLLVPLTLLAARTLGTLQFSDDTARGLGIRVDASRGALLLLAVALAAVATSAAGPIAFVALASPQIALRVMRTSQPPLIGSLLFGALLTVGADLAVRLAPGASDLPVGVLTAVLGAPYLIFLFVRNRRKERA